MNIFRFHQFVLIEKGPVNTAIIDLLSGNLFQVPNKAIEAFENRNYSDIEEFIEALKEEELIIEIDEKKWIPRISFGADKKNKQDEEIAILEIEEGADLDFVFRRFSQYRINQIHYFGKNKPEGIIPDIDFIQKERKFSNCQFASMVSEDFLKVDKDDYSFNIHYNSCWGGKVAVLADGSIRPCIYSTIVIGNLKDDTIDKMMEEIKTYWQITKDKVDICSVCELRYTCFDCREIPFRKSGNLYSCNPNCQYDPQLGTWAGEPS